MTLIYKEKKAVQNKRDTPWGIPLARLIGIEPTHPAPEAGALSTELQAHIFIYRKRLLRYCSIKKEKRKAKKV